MYNKIMLTDKHTCNLQAWTYRLQYCATALADSLASPTDALVCGGRASQAAGESVLTVRGNVCQEPPGGPRPSTTWSIWNENTKTR